MAEVILDQRCDNAEDRKNSGSNQSNAIAPKIVSSHSMALMMSSLPGDPK